MTEPTITTAAKVGVGVIVCRGGDVLLGKRHGSHGAGEWALPGGKLDPGEHPVDCAERELTEENGVRAVNFAPVGFWTNDLFAQDDLHFITLYVMCDWHSHEPRVLEPDKCLEWRWCSWGSGRLPKPTFTGAGELAERYPTFAALRAQTWTLPGRAPTASD